MNLCETASRKKFRFPSSKGELTTEQLWDLDLTNGDVNLDAVARSINSELKGVTEESFVATNPDPRKGDLELKLEVVKHIIASKLADAKRRNEEWSRAEKRRKLREALASKEDDELAGKTKEQLIQELQDIDEA